MRTPDIKYDGWGPCAHNEEEVKKLEEWMKGFIPAWYLEPDHRLPPAKYGGLLEDLLWQLSNIGVHGTTLASDMWVGVRADGEIAGKWIETYIQGDTYLIAVAETFRWWKEKYKELTGEEYD